jgi:hypothetical protein
MSAIILDTLEFAAKLKAGGFTEQQAEAQTRALAEVIEKQLTTKSEIEKHENALRRDLETMRVELKRDLKEIELRLEAKIAETHTKIAETKADLTRWIIGAGVLQTSLIIGVLMKIAKLI